MASTPTENKRFTARRGQALFHVLWCAKGASKSYRSVSGGGRERSANPDETDSGGLWPHNSADLFLRLRWKLIHFVQGGGKATMHKPEVEIGISG